nr:immunoglobulin light chain junction region [Macaca mulatta]MOW58037.1 immunoglobulin light chain junction region [Macaca mulatta]MOW60073.1 immunoglobulin light chain junction region [Macaca mulatta]
DYSCQSYDSSLRTYIF